MGLQFGFTGIMKAVSESVDTTDSKTNSSTSSSYSSRSVLIEGAKELASAATGGVLAGLFVSPAELIMITQQKYGSSAFGSIKSVINNHGFFVHGLMRGLLATCLRDSVYVCGMLGITPVLQEELVTKFNFSVGAASFGASMIGGLVAALPSHPFDVIKTCMQGDLHRLKYSSFSGTAKALWAEGGSKAFFRGGFWRTVNIVATVYIANECNMRFKSLIIEYS